MALDFDLLDEAHRKLAEEILTKLEEGNLLEDPDLPRRPREVVIDTKVGTTMVRISQPRVPLRKPTPSDHAANEHPPPTTATRAVAPGHSRRAAYCQIACLGCAGQIS
jgi:hypothetical protein